jgi:methylmalonyl-CoA/ethylmalonyl-CoA epimerase
MRLHHVAYTTNDLDKKATELAVLFGFKPIAAPVYDPAQQVRIQFLDMGDGSLLELLEPHDDKSPVTRHLKTGGGLYHLCFEVDDLVGTLERLGNSGEAVVVCDPVPAPAIENRRVAFVVTSSRDLIEFVESERK